MVYIVIMHTWLRLILRCRPMFKNPCVFFCIPELGDGFNCGWYSVQIFLYGLRFDPNLQEIAPPLLSFWCIWKSWNFVRVLEIPVIQLIFRLCSVQSGSGPALPSLALEEAHRQSLIPIGKKWLKNVMECQTTNTLYWVWPKYQLELLWNFKLPAKSRLSFAFYFFMTRLVYLSILEARLVSDVAYPHTISQNWTDFCTSNARP